LRQPIRAISVVAVIAGTVKTTSDRAMSSCAP
jgi:hypothetical protein